MTALVILHHTAITYGAIGGWFYNEVKPSAATSSLLLTLFCATNQAYFMGFFFLLAGYFTPASLERKGYSQFLVDRFIRLGLPLLAFGLILGPLTAAMVTAAQGGGFFSTFAWLWHHKQFINGPLWFAQALLIFSLVYCAWRAIAGPSLSHSERNRKPLPAYAGWLLSAIGVAFAALAIRQIVPTGQNVFGLQLGFFSSYIFLFAIGIAAWRRDWLSQLSGRKAMPSILTLIVAWPTLPAGIALANAINGPGKTNFGGGHSWAAFLYAFWEPFVAWGLIALWLLVFRKTMNQPSRFWSWLNRRAFAVYIIHPPVLVGVTLLLHAWTAPALIKFVIAGSLACAACWLLADPLVRLPALRRVI